MHIKLHGVLTMAAAGVIATGCSTAETAPGAMAPGGPATVVEVFNNNWLDINVYAVRSGTRIRLGMVRSMETVSFKLPESALATAGTIRLLADPIGSRRSHLTDGILVQRGDRIRWSLENSLALSHYSVRR